MVGKVFRCKKFKKNSNSLTLNHFCLIQVTQIHAIALHTKLFTLVLDPTLILIFLRCECGLNSNMRVKFKGGLNCQLPTAIRVKSKCGLTSRAGKMHVITVYINICKFKNTPGTFWLHPWSQDLHQSKCLFHQGEHQKGLRLQLFRFQAFHTQLWHP